MMKLTDEENIFIYKFVSSINRNSAVVSTVSLGLEEKAKLEMHRLGISC